jgi:hypothetical protein
MNKTIIILVVLLMSSLSLWGLFDDYEPGVRARGMGGAYCTVGDDANALFYNPAGLVFAHSEAKTGYGKLFNNDFEVLKTVAFSMPLPKKFGTVGIALEAMDCDYQDVNMLSEKVYSLGHSITLMKDVHTELHFGWSANFLHAAIDGMGDETTFGINAGALAILHTRTRLGFSVTNVNNPKIGAHDNHDLPQKMTVGISYLPYTGVVTAVELKKSFNTATESNDNPTELHVGSEVTLFDVLFLRAGVRTNPNSISAGAGFLVHGLEIDYAYSTHPVLEGTHHMGIGYRL